MGLLLSILSMALDINLFHDEVAGQGEAWGKVRPLQALVLRVAVVCPPARLHYPPNQIWATAARVPMPTWPGLLLALPGWGLGGCRGSHRWLGSCKSIQSRLGGCRGDYRY